GAAILEGVSAQARATSGAPIRRASGPAIASPHSTATPSPSAAVLIGAESAAAQRSYTSPAAHSAVRSPSSGGSRVRTPLTNRARRSESGSATNRKLATLRARLGARRAGQRSRELAFHQPLEPRVPPQGSPRGVEPQPVQGHARRNGKCLAEPLDRGVRLPQS